MEDLLNYLCNLTKTLEPPESEDKDEQDRIYRFWGDLVGEGETYEQKYGIDEYMKILDSLQNCSSEELQAKTKEIELKVIELDMRESKIMEKKVL
ncbi:unnamed protein product [Moneuplotes crassus]|uniref:Uncharacterized protein n=1 Tax=Euplotes crassus TaxID=5936 RepID=A0AAD1XVQ7_EUPCR|nr:unnamed protein product [Moneuplotes crassus]